MYMKKSLEKTICITASKIYCPEMLFKIAVYPNRNGYTAWLTANKKEAVTISPFRQREKGREFR